MTAEHWLAEWDEQPFRIAATPPRTIGKMVHQLAMVNYYHLTLPPRAKPRLRQPMVPGERYLPLPQPGFRWNVLDYGGPNTISSPLRNSRRCDNLGKGWHCLWQRFPHQRRRGGGAAPPAESPLAAAAAELYNSSRNGSADAASMVQYLVASAVSEVFMTPSEPLVAYMDQHLKAVCHVPGPYCGGTAQEVATPIAAAHVRHGDSCDRRRDEPGPWNAMFALDEKKGKLERVNYRWCYSWKVYRAALGEMQRLYGVRTVLLATDDHDGTVMREVEAEKELNFVLLDFPRGQFQKRGWMEFRQDVDEHVPFSIAAAIELLSRADMLIGNMGSHVSRIVYDKMVGASLTSQLPPFISVDGYGLCCDFTEECTKEAITKRRRDARECIYSYARCTGGDQWFYSRS